MSGQKNAKEVKIKQKRTRMVQKGDDQHGLQITNLKTERLNFSRYIINREVAPSRMVNTNYQTGTNLTNLGETFFFFLRYTGHDLDPCKPRY